MEQLIDFHAPEVQAVLDTLLKDKSTGKNIIWATDPPEELQTVMYEPVTDTDAEMPDFQARRSAF